MNKAVSLRDYFAEAGSRFTKKDAEIIGPQLEVLADQGLKTPKEVVEVARSKNSPLHTYFEWNDVRAAGLYREDQARTMIRAISVRVTNENVKEVVPAFSIVKPPHKPAEAQPTNGVLHAETQRAAKMTAQAFHDLVAWKAKYSPYRDVWQDFAQAFGHVVDSIDNSAEAVAENDVIPGTDAAVMSLLAWKEEHGQTVERWSKISEEAEAMAEAVDGAIDIFNRAVKAKERPCLRCGKRFFSEGIGNRLCTACSAQGASYG